MQELCIFFFFFPLSDKNNKETVMRSSLLLTGLLFVNDILELAVNCTEYCLVSQLTVSSKNSVELLISVAVQPVALVQNVLLDCECSCSLNGVNGLPTKSVVAGVHNSDGRLASMYVYFFT